MLPISWIRQMMAISRPTILSSRRRRALSRCHPYLSDLARASGASWRRWSFLPSPMGMAMPSVMVGYRYAHVGSDTGPWLTGFPVTDLRNVSNSILAFFTPGAIDTRGRFSVGRIHHPAQISQRAIGPGRTQNRSWPLVHTVIIFAQSVHYQ
jgi:hypothetical protein